MKSKEIVKFKLFKNLKFIHNTLLLLGYLINLIDKIVYTNSAIFINS